MNIVDLPIEVFVEILNYLPIQDIISLHLLDPIFEEPILILGIEIKRKLFVLLHQADKVLESTFFKLKSTKRKNLVLYDGIVSNQIEYSWR